LEGEKGRLLDPGDRDENRKLEMKRPAATGLSEDKEILAMTEQPPPVVIIALF